MTIFSSAEQFYTVLQEVFRQVQERPQDIEDFTLSNLVIRLRFQDPDAEVLLDGRQPPLEIFFGPRPGRADLELAMPASLLHQIWMGERRLREAFFGGEIQTQGNVLQAAHLTALFRQAERVYPDVAQQQRLL